MISIKSGYISYNGHKFTKAEANYYNKACADCLRGMISKEQQHKIFMFIIYK